MKKWLGLATLVLLAALVSCGGQPSGGGSSVDARDIASVLGAANEQTYKLAEPLSAAGIPVPALTMPLSDGVAPLDTASWNCDAVTATGNLTDADNDGIPVNATFNGRCTWNYSGEEGSLVGYWEYQNLKVEDPNDADASGGIRVGGKIVWGYSGGGTEMTITWTIKHDLLKSGAHYDFTYKGDWQINISGQTSAFSYNYHGTLTPDDMDNPWGNGTVTASGSFGGTSAGCESGWSVTLSLSGVHFAECGIDSGSADFTVAACDGHTCTIHISWSGCDSANYSGSCFPD